ncbi:hypothetical protein [Rugamonas sp.]|uniref:hypothetical protein n=1 Tax=Rugamonas sp. TaxID=1926287 RepID=UPI0025F943D8|nr:hypothetical protein [Rugamonas sp.]
MDTIQIGTLQKAPVVGIITPRLGTPTRAAPASLAGFPRPPLRAVGRPDKSTALRIDAGLARSAQCSRLEAFSKLVADGIPVQTASRVVWSLRRD